MNNIPLNIELLVDEHNEKITAQIKGEIDYSNYEELSRTNSAILNMQNPYKTILFDLQFCNLISSNGYGLFYELADTLKKRGKKVKIIFSNANNLIMKTVRILKMDDEFEFI